jgi:hypothetical protein
MSQIVNAPAPTGSSGAPTSTSFPNLPGMFTTGGGQQSSYQSWNNANNQLYSGILSGYGQMLQNAQNQMNTTNKGYANMIGNQQQIGLANQIALQKQYAMSGSQLQQQMISSGLGNSTVLNNALQGNAYNQANAQIGLNQALQQNVIGIQGQQLGYQAGAQAQQLGIQGQQLGFEQSQMLAPVQNSSSSQYGLSPYIQNQLGLQSQQLAGQIANQGSQGQMSPPLTAGGTGGMSVLPPSASTGNAYIGVGGYGAMPSGATSYGAAGSPATGQSVWAPAGTGAGSYVPGGNVYGSSGIDPSAVSGYGYASGAGSTGDYASTDGGAGYGMGDSSVSGDTGDVGSYGY